MALETESVHSNEPAAPPLRVGAGFPHGLRAATTGSEVGHGVGHPRHQPGHLAQIGRLCRHASYHRDRVEPLVGQESAGNRNRERPDGRLCAGKTGAGADVHPLLDGAQLHPGVKLSQEDISCLGGRWAAPAELGGQYADPRFAHPGQLFGCAAPVNDIVTGSAGSARLIGWSLPGGYRSIGNLLRETDSVALMTVFMRGEPFRGADGKHS